MSSVHLIEYIKSKNTEIYQPRLRIDIVTLAIDSLKETKNAIKSSFCDQVWIKHYNFAHKEVINDSWIQIWLVSHEFRKPLEANFSVLYRVHDMFSRIFQIRNYKYFHQNFSVEK